MPRRPRLDTPDSWHHVVNRGVARRTLFETERDFRYFLALLAREVRAKRLEVHAFCLLMNHFHLLVRSPIGRLSEAMRRLQNGYARWFNRSRHRDGPLFRGRFLSCLVDSLRYRRNVVRYIHDNPLRAAVAARAPDYRWSSAAALVHGRRPPWLATSWIEDELNRRGGKGTAAERLERAFPTGLDPEMRNWVETQLSSRLPDELEYEGIPLRYAGSPRVVRWMLRRTKLADGTRAFRPVSPPALVERAITRVRSRAGARLTPRLAPLLHRLNRFLESAWTTLRAGLLRLLAGCTHREIGLRTRRHTSTSCRDVQHHRKRMQTTPAYERLAAYLTHRVLRDLRAI